MAPEVKSTEVILSCYRLQFDTEEISFSEIFRSISEKLQERFGETIENIFDNLVIDVDGADVVASFYFTLDRV